jgi:hypothetical protein
MTASSAMPWSRPGEFIGVSSDSPDIPVRSIQPKLTAYRTRTTPLLLGPVWCLSVSRHGRPANPPSSFSPRPPHVLLHHHHLFAASINQVIEMVSAACQLHREGHGLKKGASWLVQLRLSGSCLGAIS